MTPLVNGTAASAPSGPSEFSTASRSSRPDPVVAVAGEVGLVSAGVPESEHAAPAVTSTTRSIEPIKRTVRRRSDRIVDGRVRGSSKEHEHHDSDRHQEAHEVQQDGPVVLNAAERRDHDAGLDEDDREAQPEPRLL